MTTATKNRPRTTKHEPRITLDPEVQQYIDDVLSGKIITCRYVRLAVQRHVNDLEHGHERGLYFDTEAAQRAIEFSKFCRHYKGEWAGQIIKLQPWQKFRRAVVYGWKNANGTRRFRTAYLEEARKNGKSTEAAIDGLYGLIADNEPGAEIYTTATKMDQAKIIHKAAEKMVKKSPDLSKILEIYVNNISYDETDSFFRPLGADAKTMDGLNPHFKIYDEFHAHRDSSIWDVMESAHGSRTQPLSIIVTTAGFNKECICHEQRKYGINVLEGHIEDDSFFCIIYTLDEGDDWKDQRCWIKANPNLGVSVSLDDMRRLCKKAIESPAEQNNFLVKKLNIWTSQYVKYFNMTRWDQCNRKIDMEQLKGRQCWGGLDLSSKIALSAYVLEFELEIDGQKNTIWLPKFFLPMDNIRERSKESGVDFEAWARLGFVTITPGNVIDYDFIASEIEKSFKEFDMQAVGFDPWSAEAFRQDLIRRGLPEKKFIEVPQTLKNLSEATKDINTRVLSGNFIHNAHPVLRWMADNTAVYTDPNMNVRIHKSKSSGNVDGIAAGVTSHAVKTAQPAVKESVYEERGIISIGEE